MTLFRKYMVSSSNETNKCQINSESIWGHLKEIKQSEFDIFSAASTLELFAWNLIFQVVIDLKVIAEQIWNALDWLFGFLVTYFDPRKFLV